MRACRWIIAAGFSLMMTVIVAAVLTVETPARSLVIPQGALLLLGLGAIAALCLFAQRGREAGHSRARAFLFWAALFAVQAVLCFFAYFMTGWDVKTVLESAYALAGGDTAVDHYYYSLYPNNALLTLIFAAVIRLLRLVLGNPGLDRCTYVLIVMQCGLNTLTGALTQYLALRLTGSRRFSWLAAAVYTGFIGLSPWLMIPYSDSMALIIPAAVLAIYAAKKESGVKAWLAMGLLTGVGFLIKPQAAIVSIAILIVDAMRAADERRLARFCAHACCVALTAALAAGPGFDTLLAHSGIEVREGRALGPLHFAMMGLSEQTGGMYDAEDVSRSVSIEDPKERTQMQLEEIAARLEAMGAEGFMRHLLRKTRSNFGDGMFAWGAEGGFYAEMIADKDSVLSPALKDAIGCGGESTYSRALASWFQAIWLTLLVGGIGMAPAYACARGDAFRSDLMLSMMLALGGLTLFEWLFEARARYLYLYAPVYLLMGLCGVWHASAWLRGRACERGVRH